MGPQSQSGCFGKEKDLLTQPQIELCLWPRPCTDYIMKMSNLDLVDCYALKRSGSQVVNIFQKLNNFLLLIIKNFDSADHFMYLKLGLLPQRKSTDWRCVRTGC